MRKSLSDILLHVVNDFQSSLLSVIVIVLYHIIKMVNSWMSSLSSCHRSAVNLSWQIKCNVQCDGSMPMVTRVMLMCKKNLHGLRHVSMSMKRRFKEKSWTNQRLAIQCKNYLRLFSFFRDRFSPFLKVLYIALQVTTIIKSYKIIIVRTEIRSRN